MENLYTNQIYFNIWIIILSSLCIVCNSVQNGFIGCYSYQSDVRKTVIPGFYNSNQCIEACQKKFYRYAITQANDCVCVNFLGLEYGSRPCQDVCGESCSSKSSLYDVYYTEVVVPGPPRDLQIYNVTYNSAYVSWKEPESYLDIKQYEIKAQILHTFSHTNMINPKWIFSNNTFDTELNFHPGTKYSVNVYAVSKDGEGIAASKIVETEIGLPDNIPFTPSILKREESTMEIQLIPVINNNGPITAYQVIVINDDTSQIPEVDNIKSYSEAISEGLSYYITGEIMPNDHLENFVVGDGQKIGKYFNAPLKPNINYRILVCVVSQYNDITKRIYSNLTDVPLQTISVNDVFITNNSQNHEEMPQLIVGLYIAIGLSSFVLIAGIIGFFFLIKRMSNRRRHIDTQELTLQGPIIEVANNGYIPEEEMAPINHFQSLTRRVWNIPINILKVEPHSLGIGKFGPVAGGTIKKDDEIITIAIYTIADKKLGENKVVMLKDLDILIRSGKNENVLTLIGLCESRDSLFVALEYASMNLKDLLLGSRESLPGRFTDMKELHALNMSLGIASGMRHLESLKIVHKQLCARNILITENFIPKISGFGLAQYYNPNLVPDYTRWTASESFSSSKYMSKCDIWSYACVLWEICSLGGTPYGSVPNNEIPKKIMGGLRLPQLPYISDSLYELMLNCWQLNVDERPSFTDLVFEFENIKNDNIVQHLNFSKYVGFQYEQFYPDLELAARTVF